VFLFIILQIPRPNLPQCSHFLIFSRPQARTGKACVTQSPHFHSGAAKTDLQLLQPPPPPLLLLVDDVNGMPHRGRHPVHPMRHPVQSFQSQHFLHSLNSKLLIAMASAAQAIPLSKSAMRRLMKEAQDVQEHPLPGISLAPSEDNLAEWHANVVVSGGDYDGLVMHILMDCPHDYPNSPPKAYFVNPVSYQSGATQVR